MTSVRRALSGLLVVSTGGLLVMVLSVGILAIGAELVGSWAWFFRMERTTAAVAPVSTGLLIVAICSALALVVTTTD